METSVALQLNEITKHFYEQNARSFSGTRTHPWQGWFRVADSLKEVFVFLNSQKQCSPYRILDVGCGNGRFEIFLNEEFPHTLFDVIGIDTCRDLSTQRGDITLIEADIVSHALKDTLYAIWDAERCNVALPGSFSLAVAFGLMHHIPSFDARVVFLKWLVQSVCQGGLITVSFWRFLDDAKLARKATSATKEALLQFSFNETLLESGDCFLGWQDTQSSFRYCHSFSDAEISALLECVDNVVIKERYVADTCNEYLILQRV